VMNTSHPGTKVGLLDMEINRLAKVCILFMILQQLRSIPDSLCSYFRLVRSPSCLKRLPWTMVHICVPVFNFVFFHYSNQVCFASLFLSHDFLTTSHHCSLRVNLDMGKTVYASQIMNDKEIPNTIVRTSTLPEELGRIEYLLSDKTGTLTQNGALITCFPGYFITYFPL